jgi:hypothetical protein
MQERLGSRGLPKQKTSKLININNAASHSPTTTDKGRVKFAHYVL